MARSPIALRATRVAPPMSIYPGGVRGRGMAITAKPAQQNQPRHPRDPGRWDKLWDEFDWLGWFKPSIDAAVSVGCNQVNVFGGWNGLPAGSNKFSLATYQDRVAQVFDYIVSQGLFISWQMGDRGQWNQTDGLNPMLTSDLWVQHADDMADVFASYEGSLVFVDLDNEINSHCAEFAANTPAYPWANMKDDLVGQRAAIKAKCPWLPITVSNSIPPSGSAGGPGGGTTFINDIAALGIVDFWDYHVYVSTPPTSSWWAPVTSRSSLPLYIGEFGVNQSQTTALRQSIVNAIFDNVLTNSRCMGAVIWAAFDQEDATFQQVPINAEKWGMYENPVSMTYRADVGDLFRVWPKAV